MMQTRKRLPVLFRTHMMGATTTFPTIPKSAKMALLFPATTAE